MQPGHAGVLVHGHARAQKRGAHARLGHHRAVGGPSGHDRHPPADGRDVARHPSQPRPRVLLGFRRRAAHGRARVRVGARDQDAAGAVGHHRAHDRLDLRGGLALRQHRLGRRLAQLAVVVDAGEPEIAEREMGQPFERGRGIHVAAAHGLEQSEEISPQAGDHASERRGSVPLATLAAPAWSQTSCT
jgi:hypothetical protein